MNDARPTRGSAVLLLGHWPQVATVERVRFAAIDVVTATGQRRTINPSRCVRIDALKTRRIAT